MYPNYWDTPNRQKPTHEQLSHFKMAPNKTINKGWQFAGVEELSKFSMVRVWHEKLWLGGSFHTVLKNIVLSQKYEYNSYK